MNLDPALCADGCGTPATRERPYTDNTGTELVCERHRRFG